MLVNIIIAVYVVLIIIATGKCLTISILLDIMTIQG